MAVIDLDSPAPATPNRGAGRSRRMLIIMAVGSILLGLPGDSLGSLDAATVCDRWSSAGPGPAPAAAVTLHGGSGEILQFIECPA